MVEPGTTLLGKYRIERILGRGGMGVVLEAKHLILDQPVAIKCLLPEVLANKQVVERFRREAQAASRLTTEHVCRVLDVGVLDSGAPYIVMEHLEGKDLAALCTESEDQGRLEPSLAVELMLQACEVLAEAHVKGIVHRDLKPANFMITRRADGSMLLKLLDFGISKVPLTVDDGFTHPQLVMGTPAYMAPEVMNSAKQADPRSDIWALGILLYEILEGRRPFRGSSYSEMRDIVPTDSAAPMHAPLPWGLESVIMRCLVKEPAGRYQNVAELAAALAPYAQTTVQAATTTERTSRILGVPNVAPAAGPVTDTEAPSSAPRDTPTPALLRKLDALVNEAPGSASPGTLTGSTRAKVLDSDGPAGSLRRLLIIGGSGGMAAVVLALVLYGSWTTDPMRTSAPADASVNANENVSRTPAAAPMADAIAPDAGMPDTAVPDAAGPDATLEPAHRDPAISNKKPPGDPPRRKRPRPPSSSNKSPVSTPETPDSVSDEPIPEPTIFDRYD